MSLPLELYCGVMINNIGRDNIGSIKLVDSGKKPRINRFALPVSLDKKISPGFNV